MARKPVRYAMVDAFTDTPFKGNPAAVCLLEEEEDDEWMQAVASEFNASETAFLIPVRRAGASDSPNPRFHLRWFTPLAEVELCGHATLAAAYFLFTSGVVEGEMIEFDTKSGYLTTRKVHEVKKLGSSMLYTNGGESFFIELDFPMIDVVDCEPNEIPSIPKTLNGLCIVSVQKTSTVGDLVVELASGKDLANLKPKFDEIERCAGRGVIMTAPAPSGSGFDFFTRFFCPKLGVYEDPVCGSAHCALAPYWSKKLGKHNLIAYQEWDKRLYILSWRREGLEGMAAVAGRWISTASKPLLYSSAPQQGRRAAAVTCKAKDAGSGTGALEIAVAAGGLVANPVIAVSLYVLKTTGCGLPPGPGGSLGALEGVSYLVAAGIVAWSLYAKVKTGSGLPSGPFGLVGAVEGLSYLSVAAIVVVFGFQFFERGYLPGPLPGDQCF